MPELLLLVGDPAKARNDNHERLPRGFERAGWRVTRVSHDAVEIAANRLTVAGRDPDTFDLIWPLGFGQQATFFDRLQLLGTLSSRRFVTTATAMAYLHGKHHWLHLVPETHASADPSQLLAVVSRGGDWVVKPTAGSYGRDVTLLNASTVTMEVLEVLFHANGGGYLMAQRFVPEIAAGELRTLVAGGRLIGSYLRLPEDGLRANLAAGSRAAAACPDASEQALIKPLARELDALGVGFAAIDTVGGYLMEVNVANPGGLETIERLTGRDLTDDVVQAVIDARS